MDWTPFLRLGAAALFAAGIGIDRELRAKPAGLRTNIVVGVAAAAFAYASVRHFPFGNVDESRVASQIVSGIGFLGGGAIFATGGKPQGLTTAAALWGSAAAGLNAGVGAYTTGLALVVITLLALWPLEWLAAALLRAGRREDTTVHVVVADLATAGRVRETLRQAAVRLDRMDLRPFGDRVAMELRLHGRRPDVEDVLGRVAGADGVEFLSEEAVGAPER
ncbi:MAG TPA: MgtC/SapB family protein [Nitriliruptorales bacterium]|nr:MgtC/SapB family protein [Nitriliruptorales bacterium]